MSAFLLVRLWPPRMLAALAGRSLQPDRSTVSALITDTTPELVSLLDNGQEQAIEGAAMTQFLSVKLGDRTIGYFEDADAGVERLGTTVIEEVDPMLGSLESIACALGGLCAALRVHLAPDEISREPGARLSGEVGWFVVKSTLEADVKISLTWKSAGSANTSIAAP